MIVINQVIAISMGVAWTLAEKPEVAAIFFAASFVCGAIQGLSNNLKK